MADPEALRQRFAGLVDMPACELLASPRVRAGGAVLAALANQGRLEAVAGCAVELLRSGRLWLDRGRLNWLELQKVAALDPSSCQALEELAWLVTIGTDEALSVAAAANAELPGRALAHCGPELVVVDLVDAGGSWGPLARFKVETGPAALRGLHLVAWERYAADGARFYRGRAEVAAGGSAARRLRRGDVLHLARADRAAFLEVATFDRLPLSAAFLRPQDLLELESPLASPGEELQEARTFEEAQKGLAPEEVRRARLTRLAGCPTVRQLLFLARCDEQWARVLPTLSRVVPPAYEAAESQLKGYWAGPGRLGPSLEAPLVLGLTAVAAAAVLVSAAAWRLGELSVTLDLQ